MEAKTKDIWVFIETNEDGTPKNVGLELLTPGRMIAEKQGGKLVAVVLGSNCSVAVEAASKHGADQVIYVDNEVFKNYTTDAYQIALVQLLEKYAPTSMMLGATNNGRDLGPRVSSRLQTGLTADCTALDVDAETGNVLWTRPAFGGNLMATIICPDSRPQIGTVRPGVFKKSEQGEAKAEVIEEKIDVSPSDIRTRIVDMIKDMDNEKVDLEGAEIIVSGGRGIGGPEGFETYLKPLAELLHATIGCSCAVVDAGWMSHAHQVGQTGKTVGPKLYIAVGISGAIQHLAGMSGSDVIVAVNKDEDASIFSIADYGVVGDYMQVIPVLTEEIKKARA